MPPLITVYYDVRLIGITDTGIRVERDGSCFELATFGPSVWLGRYLGQIGYAKYGEDLNWFFLPYRDQSMRRAHELDERGRIGWKNDRKPDGWTFPAHLVPWSGLDG